MPQHPANDPVLVVVCHDLVHTLGARAGAGEDLALCLGYSIGRDFTITEQY
jgi:hypothetical protein